MLDQHDLEQLGNLLDQKIDHAVTYKIIPIVTDIVNTAIDNLVVNILKPAFEDIDQQFEKIDERFEQIDQRFNDIYRRFDGVYDRFAEMDLRFENIESRLDRI
ncbi:MAG: hypothetical protein HYZ08_00060 [Candidatus Kerfeldbacteria bacterium]|nr:hypothetical protein [Candidatus Kerfeldbacteria bacterium]